MSKSAAAISNDSQYVYIGSLCRHGARSSKIVQELRRSHLDLTQSVPTAVAVLDYVKHRGSDVSDSLELQEIIAYVTVALGNWPRMTPSDLETVSRAVAAAATALCQNGAVRYAVKLATSCSIYVASPALYDGVVSGVLQSVVLPSLPLGFARTPAEISAVFTATVSESTISAIKLAADCVEAACCNNVLVSPAVVARFSRVCCVIDPRLFLVISQQLEEIISCSESKHLASQASRVIIPCVIAASVVLGKHRTVLQRLSALKSVLLSTASSKADGILHADDDRFGFLAVARACLSVSRRLPSVAFELWSALKHLDVLRPEDALVVSHLAWSLVLDGSVDNCAELLTSTPITNAGAVLSHSLLLPVVWPRISNHNETLALQCSSVTLRDALIRRFLVDARNPADVVRLCQQLGGDFTSLIDWMLTDEHTSLPFTARLVEKLGNLGLTASREVLQRLCTLCLHAQHYAAFCTVCSVLPNFGIDATRTEQIIHDVFVSEHESLGKSRASLLILVRAMLSLLQMGVGVPTPTLVMLLNESCQHKLVGTAVDTWRTLAKRKDATLTCEQFNAVAQLVCDSAKTEGESGGKHANQLLEMVMDGTQMHLLLQDEVAKSVDAVFSRSAPVLGQWWVTTAQHALQQLQSNKN